MYQISSLQKMCKDVIRKIGVLPEMSLVPVRDAGFHGLWSGLKGTSERCFRMLCKTCRKLADFDTCDPRRGVLAKILHFANCRANFRPVQVLRRSVLPSLGRNVQVDRLDI
jgi:hypothetical protein